MLVVSGCHHKGGAHHALDSVSAVERRGEFALTEVQFDLKHAVIDRQPSLESMGREVSQAPARWKSGASASQYRSSKILKPSLVVPHGELNAPTVPSLPECTQAAFKGGYFARLSSLAQTGQSGFPPVPGKRSPRCGSRPSSQRALSWQTAEPGKCQG